MGSVSNLYVRFRLPGSTRLGLALILLGLGTYTGTQHWMNTRIVYPVDMPISLAQGNTRTGSFRLNLWTDYRVYISIPNAWEWKQAHRECDPYQHLQTRWVVYQNGKAVAWLDEPTTLPWWSFFYASPGTYELDLEVLNDFRCVDPIGPRLRIVADIDSYEDIAFGLKAISIPCIFIGLCSLLFVPAVRRLQRPEETASVTQLATIGQEFRWARTLPLRRPISGLPNFGLVGGIVFAMLAMLMMLLGPVPSKGLRVHLLRPGAAPEKTDQWTDPLIIWVKDAGAGKRPNLYMNSKLVAWEDLDHMLQQELGHRREWVVYVGGDGEISYANVTDVIDTARKDQARVFLITANPTSGERKF